MSSGFLSICDINSIKFDSDKNLFHGVLDIGKYSLLSSSNIYGVCLEGVNQFCVRACYVLNSERSLETGGRILPAQIEQFEINITDISENDTLHTVAEINIVSYFYRVNGKIFKSDGSCVGQFTIKVCSIKSVPTDNSTYNNQYNKILTDFIHCYNEEVINNSIRANFIFLENSFLAHEHFPGIPILPASQSVFLCISLLNRMVNYHVRCVSKFNLILPIKAGVVYTVKIDKKKDSLYLIEINSHDNIYVRGYLC